MPERHLARFVVDVVDEFDLSEFLGKYRLDGRGGAAYPPSMMVALLVYAYMIGELSSRQIQKRCVEDVAFRFTAGNLLPDHATIARFRAGHEEAFAGLFGQVLALCVRAGLVRAELLAVDGTKIKANAAKTKNRTAEQLAEDLIKEAAATDAAEDETFGDETGFDVPEDLAGPAGKSKRKQLLDELKAEQAKNSFDEHMRQRAERAAATGRKPGGRVPSREAWERRYPGRQHANLTDPESRLIKDRDGFVQGFNAQAVVTADQIVVAAQAVNEVVDVGQFKPMVGQAIENLTGAGETSPVQTVLADAGYWDALNSDLSDQGNTADNDTEVEAIIAPGQRRHLKRIIADETDRIATLEQVEAGELTAAEAAENLGLGVETVKALLRRRRLNLPPTNREAMIAKLDTDRGRDLYKKRSGSIEPLFAQIKHNRGIRQFSRRGLDAIDSEWKLITATHNLLKLFRAAT